MSYAVINDTPGMTAELYDKSTELMNLVGKLPEGCVAQIAGPQPEGWRVVAVWESLERAQQFATATLWPVMAELGIAQPAKLPLIWEVHNLLVGSHPTVALEV